MAINSYNLKNVTASQARAKGEVFYEAWKKFTKAELKRRLEARKAAQIEEAV